MSSTQPPVSAVLPPTAAGGRPARWVFDVATDAFVGWCWLPFFVAAHLLAVGAGPGEDGRAVGELFAVVLLVSLVHQPLTLLLVYGDRRQVALRRGFFLATPVVVVAVVAVAVGLDLWLVVPVAAVWNAAHTPQQRYGLLRMYARKGGYGSAGLDRAVVYVPFLAVLVGVALLPQTAAQLESVASTFGSTNAAGVRLLLEARGVLLVLLPPLAVATVAVAAGYLRQERAAITAGSANPAKWGYLAGSAALLGSLLVDPLAGIVGYVAAHALEYVVVVARALASRYEGGDRSASLLSALAATATRRAVLLIGVLVLLVVGALVARAELSPQGYLVIVYTVGVLHFTYDAVIWKLRRPAVAASLGL